MIKRIIGSVLVLLLCIGLSGCAEKYHSTDELIEKARKEIPIADAENIEIQYAGMCGEGNKSLVWFISGNEYQAHYYFPMEVKVKENRSEYTFVKSYKPIVDRAEDTAVLMWNRGYAFLVNNPEIEAIEIQLTDVNTVTVRIEKEEIPYLYYIQAIPQEYTFVYKNDRDISKPYTYNVAYANWTGDYSVFLQSLNGDKMMISSVQHLPVYKFDTKEELDSFKSEFKDILTMDQGYDEVPSFDYITAAYDDSFFSKYSLMLSYVQANSGSYRYGVSDVYCEDKAFCMYIDQLNNPESYTEDMAGWFVVVEVDKEDIADCETFDAQFGTPLK